MELLNQIAAILKEYYNIEETGIHEQTGGWSAYAYLIEDDSTNYFLKVYDKRRPDKEAFEFYFLKKAGRHMGMDSSTKV